MTTRNLLSGPITLSAAKISAKNVIHALQFVEQKQAFRTLVESQSDRLAHIVAHHLGIDSAKVLISGQEYWSNGSFNLCVPVLVDNSESPTLPKFLIIRIPLPYRVGEKPFPGNSDEKISSEAATYAWLHENCPDVPIPRLYGFGLSSHKRFTHLDYRPWWLRWLHAARCHVLTALGFQVPSRYLPHPSNHFNDFDLGYLLIETITGLEGTLLSDSWDKRKDDPQLRWNLQRDLARIMLSMASVPLPRIGSFRLDDAGYLRLDNRPLNVVLTVQENEGLPTNVSRRKTYSRVSDFVLSFIGAFEERLLGQPNAILDDNDAVTQMSGLVTAKTVLPQLLQSRYEQGPFVFALTYVHRSNIVVDENWNVARIIDLEFACSWPIEFLQPPYWLDGRCIDEIDAETYAPYHTEFLEHLKREEMIREDTANREEPLSSMMQRSWIQGGFWVTLAVASPIAFTKIFFQRILKGFFEISQADLDKVDGSFFARLWRTNTSEIIDMKFKDRDRYFEELHSIFNDDV